MLKTCALSGILPATLLLAASFFVLLAARKAEKEQALKVFGYVIVALLWLAALIALTAGIYNYPYGRRSLKCMKSGMMKQGMGQMHGQGMMPHPEKK
ncbi:MAG: hypothetical protein ISS32_02290 [Candidatus Omnitrophica bacterium]|nr:hypothetical protein [Candidatus Omnitrophota bacterium]MBL7151614.1 hypothetical protein [Candidatus Omnitrophota bacterium]MBL7210596.1 hypothetical protein [Candidatus Omnitrophota bacterium]